MKEKLQNEIKVCQNYYLWSKTFGDYDMSDYYKLKIQKLKHKLNTITNG